jgi:adenosylcobinamide kinase/adenosylcobinamide-phosphate guanylyltransferase
MAKIVLVTGGARSGKSTYAQSLYKHENNVVYIATSKITDEEMKERIRLHQRSRPQEWETFEGTYNLLEAVFHSKHYLLDCISILTSNIMFDMTENYEKIPVELQKGVEEKVLHEVEMLRNKIQTMNGSLVMVTNEVGYSVVPEDHVARVYRDILGRINQRIASLCDEVYLVVCGVPLRMK